MAFLPVRRCHARPLPRTKYISSPYAFVESDYKPARLDEGAFLHWISKLSRPRGEFFTSKQYLRSLEILQAEFEPYIRRGLSTIDECLQDVDWDKSPGLPYVNQGCSTKRDAWTKYESVIRDRVERLVNGEYVECIFIATLKDELVLGDKEARVFLPAPFHHQLACAVLYKKFADSLTSTCHYHSSAIGINIFGQGLERSLRRLNKFPYGGDLDHVGMDTSVKNTECVRDFVKNEEKPLGSNLVWHLAVNPLVMIRDVIIQIVINPSGWYMTTILNTFKNYSDICSSFIDIYEMLTGQIETIAWMREHLLLLVGGDDDAHTTDQKWFTMARLAQWFARYGHYIESDCDDFKKAFDLTFFSHNLYLRRVELTGEYYPVACGRLGKILGSFNYLKTKNGKLNNVENAMRFVGLMTNLWPYGDAYRSTYQYLYHLIHQLFLDDGQILTPEWSGVFRSVPNDARMLSLRAGYAREEGLLFSPSTNQGSSIKVKRVFQSALKELSGSLSIGDDYIDRSENMSTLGGKKILKKNNKIVAHVDNSLKKEVNALKSELQKAKSEIKSITAPKNNVEAVIQKSHVSEDNGFMSVVNKVVEKAGTFLKNEGMETLFTLATSLLGSDFIRSQPGVTDTILPAGTVLGYIDLYPYFAEQFGDSSPTRLQRLSQTFMRWKFLPGSCVNFVPSAGALVNGQIGMFITSDPRYEVTVTGQDAVRLVHEFNGVVAQLSQGMCCPIPRKAGDFLYVDDAHESDIRFTRQGTLWVIAFTDIDISSVGSSLGELRLDYKIALKDNAVDGVTLQPEGPQIVAIQNGNVANPTATATTGYTTLTWHPFSRNGAPNTFTGLAINGPLPSVVYDTTRESVYIDYLTGGFYFTQPGIYNIQLDCSISLNSSSSIVPLNVYFNDDSTTVSYFKSIAGSFEPGADDYAYTIPVSLNYYTTIDTANTIRQPVFFINTVSGVSLTVAIGGVSCTVLIVENTIGTAASMYRKFRKIPTGPPITDKLKSTIKAPESKNPTSRRS